MTRVDRISIERLWDLISAGTWGNLSDNEYENLQRYLARTTMMWGGEIDGDIVCVFGVAPPTLISDSAMLWLWATDKVKDHEFIFVRRSQIIVKELLTQYSKLRGMCVRESTRSIRWVKWLGGKFGEPIGDFVPFVIGEG